LEVCFVEIPVVVPVVVFVFVPVVVVIVVVVFVDRFCLLFSSIGC